MAYVKRWKEDRDNLKTHIGTRVLDYFVEHLPEYKEAGDTADDEESTAMQAANQGIKRNGAGTENNLFHRGMASDDRERADEYQKDIRHGVKTFLSFVRQLGFTLVNFCYRTEGATVSLPRRPGLFLYQRR